MPLGVVHCFGHEIHQDGYTNKFLWRGMYSVCHSEGAIVNFVKNRIANQERNVSLILMQCDGIDDVPYSDSTARRLTYNPSIYEVQYPRGQENVILLTLCTRNAYRPKFLLLPLDDDAFQCGVYEHLSDTITRPPWEDRIPRVYWRGIASGNPGDNVRTQTVLRLWNHPHANVKLLVPHQNDVRSGPLVDVTNTELYDARQPVQEFVNHKYNLVLDGACIASSLQWAFASGSVPILVTHPGNDWWFKRYLEPMKHYVPVAYDLSDLEERIDWLITHDEEARAIAENAVTFSQYYLSAGFQQYHLANEIDTVINRTA
jgi:Glycosyl transferase family 90